MIMYLKELPEIIHIFYYEILFFQVKTVFFSIFKIILILKISMFFCRHPILITGENHIFALQIKKLKISNLF